MMLVVHHSCVLNGTKDRILSMYKKKKTRQFQLAIFKSKTSRKIFFDKIRLQIITALLVRQIVFLFL